MANPFRSGGCGSGLKKWGVSLRLSGLKNNRTNSSLIKINGCFFPASVEYDFDIFLEGRGKGQPYIVCADGKEFVLAVYQDGYFQAPGQGVEEGAAGVEERAPGVCHVVG